MTPSEQITSRFSQIEREADGSGRVLGFRQLRLSEQIRLEEWFPDLKNRAVIIVAASLCEIDNTPVPFAKSRGALEAMLDRLDQPGIEAGAKAWARLAPPQEDDETGERLNEVDVIKK